MQKENIQDRLDKIDHVTIAICDVLLAAFGAPQDAKVIEGMRDCVRRYVRTLSEEDLSVFAMADVALIQRVAQERLLPAIAKALREEVAAARTEAKAA